MSRNANIGDIGTELLTVRHSGIAILLLPAYTVICMAVQGFVHFVSLDSTLKP
jgi:hypothetical protein